MRGAVFAVALFAAGAGAAAAAIPQPIGPPPVFDDNTATVAVQPGRASARPTTVRLTLPSPRVCGRATGGTIAISFPDAETVPSHIPRSAVVVPGLKVTSVAVHGRAVTIALVAPRTTGMTCHSIVVAPLTVTLLPAAGLGNPDSAGTYTVTAKRGTATYTAQFQISA